jgi:small subunit ribosomal protein S17
VQEKKIKKLNAVVVGKSGLKSVKVAINYIVKHKKYGKYMKKSTHFIVHDELNQAGVGDTVEITECRPMSKTKSWRVAGVVQKAVQQ